MRVSNLRKRANKNNIAKNSCNTYNASFFCLLNTNCFAFLRKNTDYNEAHTIVCEMFALCREKFRALIREIFAIFRETLGFNHFTRKIRVTVRKNLIFQVLSKTSIVFRTWQVNIRPKIVKGLHVCVADKKVKSIVICLEVLCQVLKICWELVRFPA